MPKEQGNLKDRVAEWMKEQGRPVTVPEVMDGTGASSQYAYKLIAHGGLGTQVQEVGVSETGATLYQWNDRGQARPKKRRGRPKLNVVTDSGWVGGDSRSLVIHTLKRLGGAVVDQAGRAGPILYQEMGTDIDQKSIGNLVKRMADDGVIRREVTGKRTYRIELVGFEGEKEKRDEALEVPAPAPETQNGHATLDGGEAGDETLSDIALALLIKFAEVLGTADPDLLHRLNDSIAERQRLSAKVIQMADDLAARKSEVEGLRRQIKTMDSNIKVMARELSKVNPGPDALRVVERFMQERPKAKG